MNLAVKQWWNTPPKKSDYFFTRIRRTYQSIFPCKHSWYHEEETIIHGEDHGPDMYNRQCLLCGAGQYLVYHRWGNLRTEWKTKLRLEDFI
jgi:hypothetical protein